MWHVTFDSVVSHVQNGTKSVPEKLLQMRTEGLSAVVYTSETKLLVSHLKLWKNVLHVEELLQVQTEGLAAVFLQPYESYPV